MNEPTEQDINDIAESYYTKGYDRGYKEGHSKGFKEEYEAAEQTAFECIAKENTNE